MVAIGPDSPERFRSYFRDHEIPFRGIPDPSGDLLSAFGQEWRLMSFGRMPALLAYAAEGREVVRHLARSARDLADLNATVQRLLS